VTSTPLEVELELAAHGRTEAVEKLAELRACDVILHISGVEVVSGVKNGHADSRSPSANPRDDLGMAKPFVPCTASDRNAGKRPRLVAWADKIQAFINDGERKLHMNVYGHWT